MKSPIRSPLTRSPLPREARPTPALSPALPVARASLGALWLVVILLAAAGCGYVGKGPDADAAVDMSRAADLTPMPMCTPKNCAGCCLGDVCQPGVTAAACGTAGAACTVCSDAQKCGTDLMCAFDPSATWLVAAVKATIATTKSPGVMWRTDGSLPQPLVQYDVNSRTSAVAIVVTGTTQDPIWTATWGQGFSYAAKDLLSTGIDLQVLDQVSAMATSPISNKHHITLSQQDFVTKTLTYQDWEGVKTLSIVLQRR